MIELTPAQEVLHRQHLEEDQAVAVGRDKRRPVNWDALDPETRAIWADIRRVAAAHREREEVQQ
jgi:hypothetical protein